MEASDLIPPAPGNNLLRVIPLAPEGFPAAHAQKYMITSDRFQQISGSGGGGGLPAGSAADVEMAFVG